MLADLQRYQTDAKATKTKAAAREAFEINNLEPSFLAPHRGRC